MTTPQEHAHSGPGDGGEHIKPKSVTITDKVVRAYGTTDSYRDYPIANYTDVGATINAAIDDIAAVGNAAHVELPPGQFSYGTDIVGDVNLVISGGGGELGDEQTRLDYTGDGVAISGAAGKHVDIRDAVLVGPGSGTATTGVATDGILHLSRSVVYAFGTGVNKQAGNEYAVIRDSNINSNGDGMIGESNAWLIHHTRFASNSNHGFVPDAWNALAIGGASVFEQNGDHGIRANASSANPRNIAVRDCYFEGNDVQDILISAATEAKGAVVQNNFFNTPTGSNAAVRVDNTLGAVLSHNRVEGGASNSYDIRAGAVETETYGEQLLNIAVNDQGTRTLREGVGVNAGDPGAGNGQWAGNGREGVEIVDTTNATLRSYRSGGWVP